MKTIKITNSITKQVLSLLLLTLISLTSWGAERILDRLPDGQQVSRVNISEPMIKMGAANFLMAGAVSPYLGLITEAKNIEIYNCENASLIDKVDSRFKRIVNNLTTEEILSASEEGFETNIVMVYDKDSPKTAERKAKALIIYNREPKALNIIVVHGSFLI